jgi:hypothetical protein
MRLFLTVLCNFAATELSPGYTPDEAVLGGELLLSVIPDNPA